MPVSLFALSAKKEEKNKARPARTESLAFFFSHSDVGFTPVTEPFMTLTRCLSFFFPCALQCTCHIVSCATPQYKAIGDVYHAYHRFPEKDDQNVLFFFCLVDVELAVFRVRDCVCVCLLVPSRTDLMNTSRCRDGQHASMACLMRVFGHE